MMLKQERYKCIADPENRFNVVGKILTEYNWKKFFLDGCVDNHSFAIGKNLRSLTGKDVLEYVGYVYKLKFEKVE